MNEIEFRKRLYANPQEPDQEILDAAAANPAYQKILQQTQAFDGEIDSLVNSTPVPKGLAARLESISASSATTQDSATKPGTQSRFSRLMTRYNTRHYAIAASLLMALGISAALIDFPGSSLNSTTAELALGEEVLEHLYFDSDEIDAINLGGDFGAIAMPAVNEVMANVGTQLISNAFMQNSPVRSAKPCIILPPFQSAHLLVAGNQGAVSIIVINNSPVSVEYSFRDDRFVGIVIPMEAGNLILVGEGDEDLDQLKNLFAENLEWVI